MNNIERKRATMFKGHLETASGENIELENSAPLPLRNYRIYGNMVNVLPSGYQQILYIRADGTQHINTEYVQKSDKFVVVGQIEVSTASNLVPVFGARTSSSTNQDLGLILNKNRQAFTRTGNGDVSYNTFNLKLAIYDFRVEQNGTTVTTKIGNNEATSTITPSTILSGLPQYIFAVNNSGTADNKNGGRLYLYKLAFIDDGVTVRDFIPCYRKQDGVTGLFDLVTQTFYTNAGTGTFARGNLMDNLADVSYSNFGDGLSFGKSGSCKITSNTNNLFNMELLKNRSRNTYDSETGLWTVTAGGGWNSHILSGKNGWGNDAVEDISKAVYLPKGDYVFEIKDMVEGGHQSGYGGLLLRKVDLKGRSILKGFNNDNRVYNTCNITATEDCYLVPIMDDSQGYMTFSEISIRPLNNEKNLIYKSETKEINLGSHEPLRKIGEKADYIDYKTQSIKRFIKCKEFDGTENWGYDTILKRFSLNYADFEDFPSTDYQDYLNAVSSHFVHGSTETTNNTFGTNWGGLTVKFEQCENVTEFKSWLAQQKTNGTPFKVWYVLRNTDYVIEKKILPTNVGNYDTSRNWYYISLQSLGIKPNSLDIYCNKLARRGSPYSDFISDGMPTNKTNIIGFNGDTIQQATHLIFRVSDFSTAEQYRNWISSNQVTISYVTNIPKVEHIDLPEMPVCDFATKISCVGDLNCSKLEVEYYKN